MTTLQSDMIEIFNNLVTFSDNTVKSKFPVPISVRYDDQSLALVFEQKGKTVYIQVLSNYCLGLNELKPTYLLPEDYDYLMSSLQEVINKGELIKERTCISPENFGFDIYGINALDRRKGLEILASLRFISGESWYFKWKTKRKYDL